MLKPHRSRLPLVLGGSVLAVLLSGCASLSEKECLTPDWGQYGWRDGKNGHPANRIRDHVKACAKVGVTPDEARWQQGWSEGIRQYCVPDHGWRLGLRGEYYSGACADVRDGELFERYYEVGKRIYDIKMRVDRNYREMQRLERELADAKTDDERKKIRAKLRDLDYEQNRLRNQQDLEMLRAPR